VLVGAAANSRQLAQIKNAKTPVLRVSVGAPARRSLRVVPLILKEGLERL